MKRGTLFAVMLAFAVCQTSSAQQRYSVNGLVLKIDRPRQTLLASCKAIPGFMDAMVMSYPVRETKELEGLAPGMTIEFTLVVDQKSSFAENIHIRGYQSLEQDPLTARRLKLLNGMQGSSSSRNKLLNMGDPVPEFALIDQNRQPVALSQFAGKTVLLNFIYTRCALPNFCFRISNNFGVIQKRFKDRMGRDLVLLTITFDPAHDTPEALARYASIWKADPKTWHFLTGAVPSVQRICNLFGMDFFPDEGLMDHSLHTVIIDRHGKLMANLEGNEFTADQLGDLVQTEIGPVVAPSTQSASRQ